MVIQLRHIASHPAFLPLLGAFAVIVTAMVMHVAVLSQTGTGDGSRQATKAQSAQTAEQGAAVIEADGLIERVELAQDGAPADRIRVRIADQQGATWFVLTPKTRVLVPLGDTMVVGGTLDLAAGQQVELDLEPGARLTDGAALMRVRADADAAEPVSD